MPGTLPASMPERFTDTLTYLLSLALAAGVIAFAAYKVIKLNGMEDPPANMGLNFPPPKRRIIVDGTGEAADPMTTQSLTAAGPAGPSPSRGAYLAEPAAPQSYQLLAVVDSVAFVEIVLARGKTLVPVSVGSVLPGGLRIEAIEKRNGRWVLVAGALQIKETAAVLQ